MTDFLDEKRREITGRLAELKPLVDEFKRLEAAVAALARLGGSGAGRSTATPSTATGSTVRRRGPGRPRGSTNRKRKPSTTTAAKTTAKTTTKRGGTRRRPGRRKGSGTRAAQALSLVQTQPGITIPELAARMDIKQNYLYRVLPGLQKERKISKRGRNWFPVK